MFFLWTLLLYDVETRDKDLPSIAGSYLLAATSPRLALQSPPYCPNAVAYGCWVQLKNVTSVITGLDYLGFDSVIGRW